MRSLTKRQERFAEEYLLDLNATQAAIRAGYKPDNADVTGPRLLTKSEVADAIRRAQEERSRRTEITVDSVLAELGRLGFANMLDFMEVGSDGIPRIDFAHITRDKAAALQELTLEEVSTGIDDNLRTTRRVKFKLADKRAALSDMLRHLGARNQLPEQTEPAESGPIITHEEMRLTFGSAGTAPGQSPYEWPPEIKVLLDRLESER